MPIYKVELPVTGTICVTVEADTEKDAEHTARLNIGGGATTYYDPSRGVDWVDLELAPTPSVEKVD